MSRSIASAKQRRANISIPEPPAPLASAGSNQPSGLTLPQVIALVDTRLIKLEKFMKDTQETSNERPIERSVSFSDEANSQTTDLSQILDEYNSRFMLIAEEMAQLKDTLMKLQTYTMDVNKMLLEERVNVLSDLGKDNTLFVMGDEEALSGSEIDKFEQNA